MDAPAGREPVGAFSISCFYVRAERDRHTLRDALDRFQHHVEADLLPVVVSPGVGDRGAGRRHGGVAQMREQARTERIPDVRQYKKFILFVQCQKILCFFLL